MKNEEKPIGRGKFAVMAWEEAKRVGGLSYSPEQIQAILEESGDEMLTREEVKNRILSYLQSCITISQDEDTQEFNYVWKRNPTKSGLALALNLSPQTVIDYVKGFDRHGNKYKLTGENKGRQRIATADFDLIRKAYILIEDFYEGKLGDNKNNSGVIFWLLNRENTRWSNEQEFRFNSIEESKQNVLSAAELPKLGEPTNVEYGNLPQLEEVRTHDV